MSSFNQRYYEWQMKCLKIIKLKRKQKIKKRLVVCVTIINELEKMKTRQYSKKRYWVAPIFEDRKLHGFYHAIFPNIILEDSTFKNYFRMSATQFEDLLQIVGPHLNKQTCFREPISAPECLCLTLRYLAGGDSMRSISYQYLVGVTTVSNIIHDTCHVIWSLIHKEVLPSTLSKKDWLRIADEFETKWNFNHCIGAIDGKHVVIQVKSVNTLFLILFFN